MNLKHMNNNLKNTSRNTLMLYILTIAKMIFPLITLPYLTRVLSTNTYGMVAYVKAVINYITIIIDFGFLYSAVKEIVENRSSLYRINEIVANTVVAKLLLSIIAFAVVALLCVFVPSLEGAFFYTLIAFLTPFLSCFLLDYFFRGIEKMHYITIVFVLMKSVSTIMTVLLVKSDGDVLLVPVFDAISSAIAVFVSLFFFYRLGYRIVKPEFKRSLMSIKKSFTFFLNSVASTAFGALLTIIVGIMITDLTEIAYWGVCMQLVGAVQSLYTPISNGIYPYMIKNRDLNLIRKLLLIFMPIVTIGCIGCYIFAPNIMNVVSGEEYIPAATVFRFMVPVLFLSFPVAILGWPVLGPINKTKEMTASTVVGAITQFSLLLLFYLLFRCTLILVAISRVISEAAMLFTRVYFTRKFKHLYN